MIEPKTYALDRVGEKTMEIHINRKFKITKKLGKGSYGEIFSGQALQTGAEVAIKLEPHDIPTPMLSYEASVIKALKGAEGFPTYLWFGSQGEFNVLVMSLLGPDMKQMFKFCKQEFTLKTMLHLAV